MFLDTGDVVSGERLNGGLGTDVLRVLDTLSLTPAALVASFEVLSIANNDTVTLTAQQLAGFQSIIGSNIGLQGATGGTYSLSGKTLSTMQVDLTGSGLSDTLVGGLSRDSVVGGGGNDSLDGREGVDTLLGGSGDDTFVLRISESQSDRIGDFAGAGVAGGDTLVLQGYGAGAVFRHVTGTTYEVQTSGGLVESFTIITTGGLVTSGDVIFA